VNISKTIREQRSQLSLSQEELAEKLYVTRQTIGNWENDKSYPDIHSLILLSQIFDMTIDSLIKGDLEIMKKFIEEKDIRILKRNFTIGVIGIVSAAILLFTTQMVFYFGSMPYIIGIVTGVTLGFIGAIFIWKCTYIEKKYDVQTFKEIVAFSRGETLDEIAKAREVGKRPYQFILFLIITLVIAGGMWAILWLFSPNQPFWIEILR
jgi:transcriptional regulator with XRE-family HTH domain